MPAFRVSLRLLISWSRWRCQRHITPPFFDARRRMPPAATPPPRPLKPDATLYALSYLFCFMLFFLLPRLFFHFAVSRMLFQNFVSFFFFLSSLFHKWQILSLIFQAIDFHSTFLFFVSHFPLFLLHSSRTTFHALLFIAFIFFLSPSFSFLRRPSLVGWELHPISCRYDYYRRSLFRRFLISLFRRFATPPGAFAPSFSFSFWHYCWFHENSWHYAILPLNTIISLCHFIFIISFIIDYFH